MQMDKDTAASVELRKDVPDEVSKLIERQVRGLQPVAFYYPDKHTILSVAKADVGMYYVTAFFALGGTWVHSFDAQGVLPDEAFEVLSRRVMS